MSVETFVSDLLMKVFFTEVYEPCKYRRYPEELPKGGILGHVSRATVKLEEIIHKVSSDPDFYFEDEINIFIHETIPSAGSMWYESYTDITNMVTCFVKESSSRS